MQVRVNWGRWIVDCPREGCTNAESTDGGLGFKHFVCSNCGFRGAPEWPSDWLKIAEVLSRRPVPATRNWTPGETVADLEHENREHGVI